MLSPASGPALVALGIAAVLGVIAHELAHAVALRAGGVPCRIEVLPDDDSGRLRAGLRGDLATVTPTRLPADVSPWTIRVAALMPLCLALPFGLVLAGVVPDPFAVGSPPLELATVAWLGCSIPSPQDFSLLWYPDEAIAAHRRR